MLHIQHRNLQYIQSQPLLINTQDEDLYPIRSEDSVDDDFLCDIVVLSILFIHGFPVVERFWVVTELVLLVGRRERRERMVEPDEHKVDERLLGQAGQEAAEDGRVGDRGRRGQRVCLHGGRRAGTWAGEINLACLPRAVPLLVRNPDYKP